MFHFRIWLGFRLLALTKRVLPHAAWDGFLDGVVQGQRRAEEEAWQAARRTLRPGWRWVDTAP